MPIAHHVHTMLENINEKILEKYSGEYTEQGYQRLACWDRGRIILKENNHYIIFGSVSHQFLSMVSRHQVLFSFIVISFFQKVPEYVPSLLL